MTPTHDDPPIIIIEQGGNVVLIYSDGRQMRISPDGILTVEFADGKMTKTQ